MNFITIRSYTVKSMDFKANVESGKKITIQNSCSYSVRYGQNGVCIGTLESKVFDKSDPENFHFNFVLQGVFSFDPSKAREEIHVATYKELFAYARAIVSSTSALFGIAPIMIPYVDIEGQNIYRIDTGGLKQ